jgi:DNA-directed RNA polymerase specialized sigma24 family protein
MVQKKFDVGMQISRNFENRNSDETHLLYEIILDAVEIIQDDGNDNKKTFDSAMSFIVSVYEPYIKKVASKIFQKNNSALEFCDILQEAYVIFIQLIYKYRKEESSFSYYITFMLPQHLYVWSKRLNKINSIAVDYNILENILQNSTSNSKVDMYDYFNFKILEQDYIEFIKRRAEKKSSSSTLSVVCYKYFLGKETCSNIATELNISYHAVYEIINKIKKELKYFLHKNEFTDFKITGSGIKFGQGD